MANTTAYNVRGVDTTGVISDALFIKSIKYKSGGGGSSVIIRKELSSGVIVYEEDAKDNIFEEINLNAPLGIHVTLEGTGTKIYLYLRE